MKKLVKLFAVVLVAPASAFAAVPTEVTTALSTLQADAVAMATTVLIAIISVFAIKFLRRGI